MCRTCHQTVSVDTKCCLLCYSSDTLTTVHLLEGEWCPLWYCPETVTSIQLLQGRCCPLYLSPCHIKVGTDLCVRTQIQYRHLNSVSWRWELCCMLHLRLLQSECVDVLNCDTEELSFLKYNCTALFYLGSHFQAVLTHDWVMYPMWNNVHTLNILVNIVFCISTKFWEFFGSQIV